MTPPLLIRDAEPGDLPLVLSSWSESHEDFAWQNGFVLRFASRDRSPIGLVERFNVAVACDLDDHDQVYGWICYRREPSGRLIVGYCYVKFLFRERGVARALWEHVNPNLDPATCLYSGWCFDALCEHYRLTFDPYHKETA